MRAEAERVAAHFERMAELARRMDAVPALLLDAGYSSQAFGSWWLIFRKRGLSSA